MNEPIKPALTPEEWKEFVSQEPLFKWVDLANPDVRKLVLRPRAATDQPNFHGIAALALYGQPFGFTREMLSALRELSTLAPDHAELWELADAATDRIEALLPQLDADPPSQDPA